MTSYITLLLPVSYFPYHEQDRGQEQEVYVMGSHNGWSTKHRMQKQGENWMLQIQVPIGLHSFKFHSSNNCWFPQNEGENFTAEARIACSDVPSHEFDPNAFSLWQIILGKTKEKLDVNNLKEGVTAYTLPNSLSSNAEVKLPSEIKRELTWIVDNDIFDNNQRQLFVRESTSNIGKSIDQLIDSRLTNCNPPTRNARARGVLIQGGPGSGRSWFLNYLLMYFSQRRVPIIFESGAKKLIWIFRPDGSVRRYLRNNKSRPEEYDDPTAIYLFDSYHNIMPTSVSGFTIMTKNFQSSKSSSSITQILSIFANRVVLPRWEMSEILACWDKNDKKVNATIQDNFQYFGGNPRFVLGASFVPNAFQVFKGSLDSAIESLDRSMDVVTKAAGDYSLSDKDLMIFQFNPQNGDDKDHFRWNEPFIVFASNYVTERVYSKMSTIAYDNFQNESSHILSMLRGSLLQQKTHPTTPLNSPINRTTGNGKERTTSRNNRDEGRDRDMMNSSKQQSREQMNKDSHKDSPTKDRNSRGSSDSRDRDQSKDHTGKESNMFQRSIEKVQSTVHGKMTGGRENNNSSGDK